MRSSRLPDLQTEWRESGYGMLEVRPRGVRRDYGPILYLEPKTAANIAAIGYDMYSEPTRAAAMLAALETGQPQLTGPVYLIQDGTEHKVGLVLYLPVYRGGDRPQSLDARRSSMQGWVYVPFRMQRFVENSMGATFKDTRFRVYDVGQGPASLLYASPGEASEETSAFRHATTLEVYGRRRANHRVGDAGVAGRGVEDDLVARQLSGPLAVRNHPRGGPVLDRSPGILPLGLRVKLDIPQTHLEARQADQWRISNQVDNRGWRAGKGLG